MALRIATETKHSNNLFYNFRERIINTAESPRKAFI